MTQRTSIDVATGDDPAFLHIVEGLLTSVLGRCSPRRLYLIRVDSWFGGKWLKFSGKLLGAVGIARSSLTLPPFVPSRIVCQHVLESPEYALIPSEAAIHLRQPSASNLQRRVAELYPDSSFLWFSGNTARNQRGSTMAYIATADGYWVWYAGWARRATWSAAGVRGISHPELDELLSV